VVVSGNYAYVADGGAGLQVIDWSTPAAPVRVGGYDTSGDADGVAVSGNYAYVADDDAGLVVINVSNPAAPVRVGGYDTGGTAVGVALAGNYAYVADGAAGLVIIDVNNPAAPLPVGGFVTSDYAGSVAVSGNYAYLAIDGDGLLVLDVSNPAAPALAGSYDTVGAAWGVAVFSNYVYVADGGAGLQVIDVSNPAAPVRVGGYNTRGWATGVTISGANAYVADDDAGVLVLDVSNPTAPVLVGRQDTRGIAESVAVSGNYVFVADNDWGLAVLQYQPALSATRLRLTWPNSSNEFALESAPRLTGPWLRSAGTVVETNGLEQLTIAPFESAEFFRLQGGEATELGPPVSQPNALERGPSLSSDGLSLYFFSNLAGNLDLWVTTRASLTSAWQQPINLDAINTPANEVWPALSADGLSLFFSDSLPLGGTLRPGGFGGGDLWVSTRENLQAPWQTPLNLGLVVNSSATDNNPAISSDGLTLLFTSQRPGNGGADLWMTTRTNATDLAGWTPPVNLGTSVNSNSAEAAPNLSKDGLTLYFMSNRGGSFFIWVATRNSPSEPFGAPVRLPTTGFQAMYDPCISADGSTLFFAAQRQSGELPKLWQRSVLPPPPLSISRIVTPAQP
jgi:hypothetical protein